MRQEEDEEEEEVRMAPNMGGRWLTPQAMTDSEEKEGKGK